MRRRRRRNPLNAGSVGGIAALLAVGGVAYLLWRLYNKGSQAVTAAGAAVSKALVPQPTGKANIVLDSGIEIPYESVTFDPWYTHWSGSYFTYAGQHYSMVSGPDETNTYYAIADQPASYGGATGSF